MEPRIDWRVAGVLVLAFVLVGAVHAGPYFVLPSRSPNALTAPGVGPINPGPANPGQTTGAPSWVAAGGRLTWYAAAASVAQSRFSWIEDPNGNWTDPKTGKRYRRTDESGEGQGAGSGDGLSQIDIVALDGANVVLSATLFTIDRNSNRFIASPAGGSAVNAAAVDGAWFHPGQLAQVAQTGFGDLLVLRGNYQLGNTTYDATSFTSGLGGSGSYASYTYDSQTGILLSANTSTAGVTSPFAAPGENPPVGNTQLTIARFAGHRQRNLPGAAALNPDWVAGTSQLTYQGTYNFINPVDPSSANFTYPMEHTVAFRPGGASWVSFTARSVIPALGQDTRAQGVSGPTGTYSYDPQALGQMSQGQVLDQDPLTGEVMSVSFVGQGNGGNAVVVIDTQMPGSGTRATYELATGMLVGYETTQASTGITISLRLVDRH